jgi:hypothetical protein
MSTNSSTFTDCGRVTSRQITLIMMRRAASRAIRPHVSSLRRQTKPLPAPVLSYWTNTPNTCCHAPRTIYTASLPRWQQQSEQSSAVADVVAAASHSGCSHKEHAAAPTAAEQSSDFLDVPGAKHTPGGKLVIVYTCKVNTASATVLEQQHQ